MKKVLFTLYFILLACLIIWRFQFSEWTLATSFLREAAKVLTIFVMFGAAPVLLYFIIKNNKGLIIFVAITCFIIASCNSYLAVGTHIDGYSEPKDVQVLNYTNNGKKLIVQESFNGKHNSINRRQCIVQDVWLFRKYISIGAYQIVGYSI